MEKNLKRIAVLNFYSGKFERGAENWILSIAQNLKKDFDITLFQNGDNKDSELKTITNITKVDWDRSSTTGTLQRKLFLDYWSLKIAFWTLKNLKQLWQGKFDIVIPVNGGWQVGIMRIVTWLKGSKMVVVGHSGRGWDDANNLWAFPDLFVALTGTSEEWARRVNPFIKVTKIPNGVDLNNFTPTGVKSMITLKPPVVISVGALEPEKRHDLTINAVALLKDVSLLILGEGSRKKEIIKLGESLLKGRFEVKSVTFDDIPSYYRTADLFTLCSWGNEAFGLVYLEAMATNLPVVATNDTPRQELIGNAGILIDPMDTSGYAKAIKKALSTDWKNIPRRQSEKYSWQRVTDLYRLEFNKILKS